ncbi:Hypothetical protein GbCGDNIH6_8027a [Granulibacter bethesdensis]|nr:Hypothetical protein GbCGDNIH6_8027a [Granulibacter bethesdensis]
MLWVYLRARGGTSTRVCTVLIMPGLSPRTRRNPNGQWVDVDGWGSISAHAEEPCERRNDGGQLTVYLRARGGTHLTVSQFCLSMGLSPRTRRNHWEGVIKSL